MQKWLTSHYPLKVESRPGRGRCVLASQALPAGTLVMACTAAAAFPLKPRDSCSTCYASSASLLRCVSCRAVCYCSRACQKADWRVHKGECEHHSWLWGSPITTGAAASATSTTTIPTTISTADATTLLLLSRLHRGVGLRGGAGSDPAPVLAAMESTGVYSHTLDDVEAMESRKREEVPGLAKSLEGAIEVAGRQGLWIPVDKVVATPHTLLRTALAFDVNDFSVTNDLCMPLAAGVYPAGALLNHSCAPNCVALYATLPQAAAAVAAAAAVREGRAAPAPEDGGEHSTSSNTPSLPPLTLMFRTTRAVEAGEELCHSYVDLALPREARREYLSSTYGFVCGCPACTAPEGSLASTDEVLLGRYSEGCCVEVSELHLAAEAAAAAACVGEGGGEGGARRWVHEEITPNPRHWVELPKRVGLGVPTLSKVGGGAGEEVSQHSLSGVPSPLKRELLLACDLVEAGRFSERPGGKDALAMFPIKLNEEALERVRFAAIGEGGEEGGTPGLGPTEALTLGREAWALETALGKLRPLLHPFHCSIQGAVAAAFDKFVALNDLPAAAAACEHLCAFYRRVYTPLCPAHPLLALQLFSLGDIYHRLAAMAAAATRASAGGVGVGGGAGKNKAHPPWRTSPARATRLACLFVTLPTPTSSTSSMPLPVPVEAPFSFAPGESPVEAAARWRRRALEAHTECAALLEVAYGPTHRLTVDIRGILKGGAEGDGAGVVPAQPKA